jgi:hypothetical protein
MTGHGRSDVRSREGLIRELAQKEQFIGSSLYLEMTKGTLGVAQRAIPPWPDVDGA